MNLNYYTVDAFAEEPFTGNPAAVMVLEQALPEKKMQAIAAELNLSETAFVVPLDNTEGYSIRWFAPQGEVDLCGHATLASAHVLFNHCGEQSNPLSFHSASGVLTVERLASDLLELDFPANTTEKIATPKILVDALGVVPQQTRIGGPRMLAVLDSCAAVTSLSPDMALLRQLEQHGICCTALGDGEHSDVDFVCRFFAPTLGIDEDPVTGSAYTALVPYYAKVLSKKAFTARQLSQRGGHLTLGLADQRVKIAGKAITVAQGTFYLN